MERASNGHPILLFFPYLLLPFPPLLPPPFLLPLLIICFYLSIPLLSSFTFLCSPVSFYIPHTIKLPSEDRCSGLPMSSSLNCIKREEKLLRGAKEQAPLGQGSLSALLCSLDVHLTELNLDLDHPLVPNCLFASRRAQSLFSTVCFLSLARPANKHSARESLP